MKNLSETLAGRVGILKLQGLSQAEERQTALLSKPFLPTADFLNQAEKNTLPLSLMQLYKRIWRGSFPAIAVAGIDHDVFYSSYLQTYIQRDVRDLTRVGDEGAFLRLVRAAAARSGQLLNMADIGRDVDIDNKTVKHWLSILETSGLIYLLEPYHTNLTKRLVKTPKLYFLEMGLCCYLNRWTSAEVLEAGAMLGAIFESYVFSEILKSYWHNAKTGNFYFYRDKDQKEIDFLIEENGTLYPVEFKKTANPNRHAVKHFSVLDKLDKPIGGGALICMLERHLPLSEGINAIPTSYL